MIPSYPVFRPLTLEDKVIFDGIFRKYPPQISEFTFTNLFAWRKAYQFQVSQLESFVLVALRQGDKTRFLNPLGEGNPVSIMEKVFRKKNGVS